MFSWTKGDANEQTSLGAGASCPITWFCTAHNTRVLFKARHNLLLIVFGVFCFFGQLPLWERLLLSNFQSLPI